MSVHLEGGEYMQGLSIICKAVELHPSRLPGWSTTSGEMWVWFESLRSSWTCSVILIRQFELCEASGRRTHSTLSRTLGPCHFRSAPARPEYTKPWAFTRYNI
ncbi:hypothetical protein RSAG8_13003, partial [Rhizoctonia solani AG-8 WAC10335]